MSVDEQPLEVLGTGHEPRRRRVLLAGVATVLVLALAGSAWFADRRSRQGEYAAISACVAQASRDFGQSMARVTSMAEYVRPALTFASNASLSGLYNMVARRADGASNQLTKAQRECAAVRVQPWHRAQRAALDAQLTYVDAERRLLSRIALDGRVYFENWTPVTKLRSQAAGSLAKARAGSA